MYIFCFSFVITQWFSAAPFLQLRTRKVLNVIWIHADANFVTFCVFGQRYAFVQ